MRSLSDVGIGIVTALPVECAAMRYFVDDLADVAGRPGDPKRYVTGTMPSTLAGRPHRVVVTVMAQDNNKNAAAACIDLLRSFSSIQCVLMVGIAGGIPTAERDVRLGDVVVGTDGVVDYDHVRRDVIRRQVQGLSMALARAAQEVRVGEHLGLRPWEDSLCVVPQSFARPADSTDILSSVSHRDGMPKVHYAAIASADRLLRDAQHRNALVHRYPEVAAVEMEGSGIAAACDLHGAHWFVVRGIADYCDNSKDFAWHAYASLTAAAYVRALLAHTPPLTPARPRQTDARTAVIDLLMDIRVMGDAQARQLIVEQLRPEIRGSIRRFQALRPDLYEIVSTCLNYEGGMGELADAIRLVVGDSLRVQRAIEALEAL
ncbi:effector-associated domain 2-containing protein [Allorhizocola rhizosphaerae]|uniref:effector-associated domain 2-containing protein n=1 Tax=Allorhizocola rhizosphaerae TaxID=1872709 RepID=UPI0013C36CF6|nr:hypothetical protein [Allorhizocola rhizosphaerae]